MHDSDEVSHMQSPPTLFPFKQSDAERVIQHPETPSAYVEWRELLPFVNLEGREFYGNLFKWSYHPCTKTLGASRDVFATLFADVGDDVLDEWMFYLSETPVIDFINHHLPFMQNVPDLILQRSTNDVVQRYLSAYAQGNNAVKNECTMPETVIIEITKSCNFTCSMCSSRTHGFRADRTLSLEDFGEIIRQFGPPAATIRINGYGESTIVPNLNQYLDCLEEFSFRGTREIITNFSAPLKIYLDLIQKGFLLLVSWDATNQALFESIRHGADFQSMLEHLKVIGRELSNEPERLVLLSTIQKKNIHEIVPLVDFAGDIGAGLVIFNMVKEADGSPWMENRYSDIIGSFVQAQQHGEERGVKIKIPDHIGNKPVNLTFSQKTSMSECDRPWKEVVVHWDTEITVCNMFNPYSYGTLFHAIVPRDQQNMEQRFRELWHGPNARLFRSLINTPQPHPYCRGCYFM
ncbi:MAG: SPASM domain-containing protein [Candidatus Cloacimonetes bacterium]|nr:SPASM domain-containing protein [Candidatus Cloacimonadota bacterium]